MTPKNSLQDPLGRVRGLGSAKEGTAHWWTQRVTSLALVPLTIWFVWSVIKLLNATYSQAVEWLEQPFSAVMMILFVGVTIHHTVEGLQVVVEDYVHNELPKLITLLLIKFLGYGLAVAGILAVAKVYVGA